MKKFISVFALCLLLGIAMAAGVQAYTVTDGSASALVKVLRNDFSCHASVVDTFLYGMASGISADSIEASGLTVTDKNGAAVTGAAFVGTGMKLQAGGEIAEVVIFGDANGDGNVNAFDMVEMKSCLLSIKSVSGSLLKAQDALQDGTVNLLDLVYVKKHTVSFNSGFQTPDFLHYGTADNTNWPDLR